MWPIKKLKICSRRTGFDPRGRLNPVNGNFIEKSSKLGKRQVLNYDHDLDMRSSFFMAFMSKAALNTIKSKFFISLEQSPW